jgi:peptidoglycan hydrolase CwlO-like protein
MATLTFTIQALKEIFCNTNDEHEQKREQLKIEELQEEIKRLKSHIDKLKKAHHSVNSCHYECDDG